MGEAIEYLQWVPGKRHFACERIHGTLSTDDCAARHRQALARGEDADFFTACRHCPIGAQHLEQTGSSDVRDASLPTILPDSGGHCLRCGRCEVRIVVSSGLCVSCANRAAEYRRGRNAKGSTPITYVAPRPRRIGVVVDGMRTWRDFDGQNPAEPLARARRQGLVMHAEAPGKTRWNRLRHAFEYIDDAGRVLVELEVDGEVHFIGVDQLRAGEVSVRVMAPTLEFSGELFALWLRISGEGEALPEEWRHQAVLCSECRHAPLYARQRGGRYECRCPACGDRAVS